MTPRPSLYSDRQALRLFRKYGVRVRVALGANWRPWLRVPVIRDPRPRAQFQYLAALT